MNKNELIKKYTDNIDDKILLAQIIDKLEIMQNKNIVTYTKFLNEHQRSLAERLLAAWGDPPHVFIPQYNESLRTVLVFLPDYLEPGHICNDELSPITYIRASYPSVNELSHRDFLGGLLACGIKRETIGDIFVGNGTCDMVVMKEILPFLLSSFETVGRAKITVSVISSDEIQIPVPKLRFIRDTVASLRFDSVVSSGFSISRDKASSFIRSGLAQLNHQECIKSDKLIEEGDIISVRGMGKIQLTEIGGITKKGRTAITIKKYI